ncbi:MAG: hypothetical protein J5910_06270 [Lachnospiraceae bacterium]|nr:hypothetical protein [Lachnospiraceae bacterium]
MGINSYGLFGNGQSGPYNNRNYELERQLQTRQQQLNDLDRMPSLTAQQQEKRAQLLHAVDTLSGKLSPSENAGNNSLNSIGNRDTADGIVIPKSKMDAANAYSKMDPAAGKRRTGYAGNEYTNSGNITYKNPGRYDGSATTPQDTYLKGFFVDIKL